MELGGIEPPSAVGKTFTLRPFPSVWLAVATLPGQAGHEDPAAGSILRVSAFFRAVSGLSLRSTIASVAGLR